MLATEQECVDSGRGTLIGCDHEMQVTVIKAQKELMYFGTQLLFNDCLFLFPFNINSNMKMYDYFKSKTEYSCLLLDCPNMRNVPTVWNFLCPPNVCFASLAFAWNVNGEGWLKLPECLHNESFCHGIECVF